MIEINTAFTKQDPQPLPVGGDTFATPAIGSGGHSFYLFINVSLVLSGKGLIHHQWVEAAP